MSDEKTLKLVLDESNELTFDVSISVEGDQRDIGTPDVRFICECGEFEYAFRGTGYDDGTVRVVVPPMKGMMREGRYDARLEVIVDGRHFCPLEVVTEFVNPVAVVAEGVRVKNSITSKSGGVKVSATPRVAHKRAKRARVGVRSERTFHKRDADAHAQNGVDDLKKMDELLHNL